MRAAYFWHNALMPLSVSAPRSPMKTRVFGTGGRAGEIRLERTSSR